MNHDKRQPERIFLSSFRFTYSWLCRFVGLGLLLAFLLAFPEKNLVTAVSFVIGYLLGVVFLIPPATLLLTWICRVRLVSSGIHGGTFWSTPVFMTWAEMEKVERRKFIGLPFLRITSFRESCPPLWLPTFLATPQAFQEAVTEHTSALHPLRRSLENGGTTEQRTPLPLA